MAKSTYPKPINQIKSYNIILLGAASTLTLGAPGSYTEWGRTAQVPSRLNSKRY